MSQCNYVAKHLMVSSTSRASTNSEPMNVEERKFVASSPKHRAMREVHSEMHANLLCFTLVNG
jgi:hypothetical protein